MNYSIIRYILGWVLMFEGAFLMLPVSVAIVYKEKDGYAFAIVMALCLILGFLNKRNKPENTLYFAKEGFAIVALSWILMSIMGAIPFVLNGDIPSYTDALFETISGFTTTGASALTDVEVLSKSSLFWRSFTHWIGGMGVIVFILAVMPMSGGYNMHLMRAESPGPSVGKLVPRMRETAKILYIIYFIMTIIEIILLLVVGMPVFDALTTAFGTAGTGGFGIKNTSIADYSASVQVVVTVFMILFGVNFNAYYLLLGKNKENFFKVQEVRWYFGIIFASIIIITFNILPMFESLPSALLGAAFQVGSIITTTGFATEDFNLWPELSKTILVMLMFVGACAGSTGGGIKVSRIMILIKSAKNEILQFIHPRSVKVLKMEGRVVEEETVRNVLMFIVIYLVIFVSSIFLISLDQFDIVTNFTAVIATINNIGPGLEMVGPTGNYSEFSNFSKYVLMFDMLAGRLELYPMLIIFSPRLWRNS